MNAREIISKLAIEADDEVMIIAHDEIPKALRDLDQLIADMLEIIFYADTGDSEFAKEVLERAKILGYGEEK